MTTNQKMNASIALNVVLAIALAASLLWKETDQRKVDELKSMNQALSDTLRENLRVFGVSEQDKEKYTLTQKYVFSDAKSSRKEYFKHYTHLATENSQGKDTVLKGLYLDLGRMPELDTAESLYLMVGMRPIEDHDVLLPDKFSSYFSLFVFGFDKNDSLIWDNSSRQKPVVYEYLNPCPPRCPTKLEKLMDTP